MVGGLPDGAFLAWRYVDGQRGIDRGQIYWDDGRVEALEDTTSELVCTFDRDQVEAARRAVVDSGLPDATDRARGDTHDTASITYWWRVAGRQGTFVNAPTRSSSRPRSIASRRAWPSWKKPPAAGRSRRTSDHALVSIFGEGSPISPTKPAEAFCTR